MNNPFEALEARLTNIELLLLDIKQNNMDASRDKGIERLITIKETAAFLTLSVPTIYGLVRRAEIPVSKRGKRLYFSSHELSDWIKAGRKKTVTEIKTEARNNFISRER